jgi:hypothetical protein
MHLQMITNTFAANSFSWTRAIATIAFLIVAFVPALHKISRKIFHTL